MSDSKRMRNACGAGIGSISFWVVMVALLLLFGFVLWSYLSGV